MTSPFLAAPGEHELIAAGTDLLVEDDAISAQVLQGLSIGVLVITRNFRIRSINHAMVRILGLNADHFDGSFLDIWATEPHDVRAQLRQVLKSSKSTPISLYRNIDGGEKHFSLNAYPLATNEFGRRSPKFIVITYEKTNEKFLELKNTHRLLQKERMRSLRAEHALLNMLENAKQLNRELHHRVKNNLAVLAAMVRHERRQVPAIAHPPLLRTEHRIFAMGDVQKAFDTANRDDEPQNIYVHIVVNSIVERFRRLLSAFDVKLSCEITPVILSVDQATPLALFISEAILNAKDCAMARKTNREILVSVQEDDSGNIIARVSTRGPLPQTGVPTIDERLLRNLMLQLGADCTTSGTTAPPDDMADLSIGVAFKPTPLQRAANTSRGTRHPTPATTTPP